MNFRPAFNVLTFVNLQTVAPLYAWHVLSVMLVPANAGMILDQLLLLHLVCTISCHSNDSVVYLLCVIYCCCFANRCWHWVSCKTCIHCDLWRCCQHVVMFLLELSEVNCLAYARRLMFCISIWSVTFNSIVVLADAINSTKCDVLSHDEINLVDCCVRWCRI